MTLPLVFIHGAGGVGQLWQNQLLAFPGSVAPDLPGHPSGVGCSTVPEYARWLDGYLLDHGLRQSVLVGHSLGGAIVLQNALDDPGALRGIVLVGTGARLRVREEFFTVLRDHFDDAVEELLRWWFTPAASPRVVERARQALRTVPASVIHDDFWATQHFDLLERVGEIRLPALILCGRDDRLTPVKYSEYLAHQITGSQLVVIPGAGHMALLEQPRACNDAIAAFVNALDGR